MSRVGQLRATLSRKPPVVWSRAQGSGWGPRAVPTLSRKPPVGWPRAQGSGWGPRAIAFTRSQHESYDALVVCNRLQQPWSGRRGRHHGSWRWPLGPRRGEAVLSPRSGSSWNRGPRSGAGGRSSVGATLVTVSYTHLTLPTIYSV